MSNSSSSEWKWETLSVYLGYALEGLFIWPSNLFLVLCICRYSALRSKNSYIVLLGLSLADSINNFAYFYAGTYRMFILVSGQNSKKVSLISCITMPFSLVWPFADSLAALMLALVSLDRFLSVCFPLEYIGWSCFYSFGMVGGAYLFSLLFATYGFYLPAYHLDLSNITIEAPCYGTPTFQYLEDFYRNYYWQATQYYASLSVLLYAFVWLVFKYKQRSQVSALGQQQHAEQLKQQNKLTTTLAIGCLFTFLTLILGSRVGSLFSDAGYNRIAMALYVFANSNAAFNMIIYPLRHDEIRMAFGAFVRCKNMPDDLRMWKSNLAAQTHSSNRVVTIRPAAKLHTVQQSQRPNVRPARPIRDVRRASTKPTRAVVQQKCYPSNQLYI